MKDSIAGLSIVIPSLNESATIERAVKAGLEAIRRSGLPGEVIVSDNGSSDGSQSIASAAGARVVNAEVRGYGAALDFGIRSARFDFVSFADADLSYPLQDMDSLLTPLSEGRADFVLGSRLGGTIQSHAMPLLNRYLGTPVLSFLIRRFFAIPTSDCNSGMRAFRRTLYPALQLTCPGMEYASEMLIRVGQLNIPYAEVPIVFRKDQRGRAPHLRRWRDGWRHLRFILGNAPSTIVFVLPSFLGVALSTYAFAFSFKGSTDVPNSIHYHSAFIAIAFALPLFLFAFSSVMIKVALHASGQSPSRLAVAIENLNDRNIPIRVSLVFLFLGLAEVAHIFTKWAQSGFGELAELPSVIRMMLFAVAFGAFFSLDMALGILKLMPWRRSSNDVN